MDGNTSEDSLIQSRDGLIAVLQSRADESAQRSAVFLVDDDVVADVDKAASEVTGIGRLHGRISKTFTGTVGRDEVLQHRHAFLEVRENRVFNGTTSLSTCLLRFCHQTTHTSELFDLVLRTTGSGVEHHVDCVKALVGLGHLLQQHLAQTVVHVCPCVDDLVVTLIIGNEAHVVVVGDGLYLIISFLYKFFLLFRDDNVIEVEGKTCEVCHTITEVLNAIKELACFGETDLIDDFCDDVAE